MWQSVSLSLSLGEGGSRVPRKRETDEGNPREALIKSLNHFRKSLCGRPLAARFFSPISPPATNPHKLTSPPFPAFCHIEKNCIPKSGFCVYLLDTVPNSCYNPAHIEITL